MSPGLPDIKEKSGIWNLVPVGKCSSGGPVIPGSRRNLFKDQIFGGSDNAYISRQVACGWGAACKGGGGVGRWSAPGMVQCRGTRRRGTVVGVCLMPEGGVGVRV